MRYSPDTGWTANSVEFRAPQQEPITWHLGTVTGKKLYVGLEQSNMATGKFLADATQRWSKVVRDNNIRAE